MTLCSLCQRIPFNDLPDFPDNSGFMRIADDSSLPAFFIEPEGRERHYSLGYQWHESLETLAKTAKLDCPLCSLVQTGVQAWLDSYRKAETTNELFMEYASKAEPIPNGQLLWISKRRGGGAGFAVLVHSPKFWKFLLLTGVSFSISGDHRIASEFGLRRIDSFSGSSQSLDVMARWVEQCANDHEECGSCDTIFPSRVLDVGSSGDIIKLIEPESSSMGRYACLSHCWGSSVPLTTTRQTLRARMSGISMLQLPKTFHDAVVIVRRLSIRYLWIDSLCILQDDRTDWAHESATMTAVYSNAYIVIAADHASDSSQGCFHMRPPRPGSAIPIPSSGMVYAQVVYNADECPWSAYLENEPLTTRGWTLQESVLAARILHFTRTQMHFECNRGRISEDGCCTRVDFRRRLMEFRQTPTETSEDADFDLWCDLLREYGRRKLTCVTDKLPAMSGLAEMFSTRFGALYVAGLWSNRLIEGLAWQCLGPYVPMSTDEYIGPSWSWASFGGCAAGEHKGQSWKDVARVEAWHTELQDEENPYGGVKSARVRISCAMTRLDCSERNTPSDWGSRRLLFPYLSARTAWSNSGQTNALRLDHRASGGPHGEWWKWDLSVIILGGFDSRGGLSRDSKVVESQGPETEVDADVTDDSDLIDSYFGLAVIPIEGDGVLQWKRVGCVGLDRSEGDKIIENKEAWKTVTLV